MIVQTLIGIFLAACLFAAMLWSIYRAVTTKGMKRINAVVVTSSTLLAMLGLTYGWSFALLIAGPACILFGLAQVFTDPGWAKLLPAVQFIFGLIVINILMMSAP